MGGLIPLSKKSHFFLAEICAIIVHTALEREIDCKGWERMEYGLDLGLWNSVFAVPCALVDRHLKLAGKEQLQAILWLLRHSGKQVTPQQLADALGMSPDTALDALEYWRQAGLLAAGERRPASPAAAQETPPPLPGTSAQEPLLPKRRMPKPDMTHLAARMGESEEIRFLMQEATFGKTLSPAMSATLLSICDDYGLPVEVAVMLLHYAKEVGKTGTSYIDSVARDWAESGIFTLEAAERKLQELSEKRLAWGKVESAAGLPRRSPTKREEEAAYRWVYQWKFTSEMLTAAYERCADNIGKFNISYINKILEGWHAQGVRNLRELEELENHRKEEREKNKSYDIEELEKISFFDLPEEL